MYLGDSGTTANVVEGDFIGTDVTGTQALPNFFGVLIQNTATSNTIGGTTTAARDVIAHNTEDGVAILVNGTSANVVEGDSIQGNRVNGVAVYERQQEHDRRDSNRFRRRDLGQRLQWRLSLRRGD